MFRVSLARGFNTVFRHKLSAHCGSEEDAGSVEELPTLVGQADASRNVEIRIHTPAGYDNVKNTMASGSVSTFDGFRCAVQKQINLNAVVSHFYWIGSQNVPPIYQYRLILPFEDGKVIQCSTDAEFGSVEGEIKVPISGNRLFKISMALPPDGGSHFGGDLELSDDSSTAQFNVTQQGVDTSLSFSLMQAITPTLTLGGVANYSLKSKDFTRGFAALYNMGEHSLAMQWEKEFKMLYLRKVNPNRVHVSTDLTIDGEGNSSMTVATEYMLKQGKLHMSIDSSLMVKSLVETTAIPGVTLQFSADLMHLQGQYRFGFGITMG